MNTAAGRPVYLDYAASAPLEPRVAELMCACLRDPALQANPSAVHRPGRAAAAVVAQARARVAALIGAGPEAIVFTSGATESVNLAVLGTVRAAPAGRGHVVTARTEHRAGLEACRELERAGHPVTWLRPDAGGRISAAQVGAALRPDTALVSLMHANNELGVLTDLVAIGRACAERDVPLHVDAAQSAGRVPLDVRESGVALLSFCAHKLGGPKGIGALYLRRRPRPALRPLLFGGGQEGGLRPGTLATPLIAGFGLACEIAVGEIVKEEPRVRALRERLWAGLQPAAPVWRNGAAEPSVPGILNVCFPGIEGESLLFALDGQLAATSGSACSSASGEPSPVLTAIGRSELAAQASLRLSLGRHTTAAEVDAAAALLIAAVQRLRRAAPPGAIERIA
ncbi:MAG: cysteine desulfurase [Gammaproteobacteria bacterium]|nr:cysteine desulfurase [Gammaproteobacteria bacterium]